MKKKQEKSRSFPAALTLLCLFVVSCDRGAQLENKDPEAVSLAKRDFSSLQQGQYEVVENAFDPALKGPDFRAGFDLLVATIPKENPISVSPSLARIDCNRSSCIHQIILDYRYKKDLLLFNVVRQQTGSRFSIIGMNIRIIPESAIKANEFRLSNKGFAQYGILLTAILLPLFSLYVFVLCIRAKIGIRKWLWAGFILIGVSRFGVNWSTGQLDFQLFAIQFLSVAGYAEQYGPWTVYISIPLGAILFLLDQSRRAAQQNGVHKFRL